MLFYYHYNLIHFYRLKKALPRHGNIPAMSMNYTLISYSKPDCSDGGATLFLAGADHGRCEKEKWTRRQSPYVPPWSYTVSGLRWFRIDEKKRRL